MKVVVFLLVIVSISCALPANYSWANQNGVNYLGINQNQNIPSRCQSGWAFATINTLNSRVKLRMNRTNFRSPYVSLSSQVLLECDSNDMGCLGGEPSAALRWIKSNNITDQSCNYYKAKGYTNGLNCSSRSKCEVCTAKGKCSGQANSKIYSINSYGAISGEQAMMQQIYDNGPIVCGIGATDLLRNHTTGIFRQSSKILRPNHYVSVYGWGETSIGEKYWNVMNSWGTYWSQGGNFMIAKGENNAGMESLCYWANVTDTWTNDVRNNTLPTEKATSLTDTITLPPYLVPSKSMYSPDYCESSWAFAVTEMISDRLYRSSKGMTLRTFSVQALLNCGVGSCQTGGNPLDALVFISKYGIPEEGCQNYKAETPAKESCSGINNCANCGGNSIYKSNCTQVKGYKRWKIADYGNVVGAANMKIEIDSYGPIVCGIELTKTFRNYEGGVFSETTVSPKIDHYVEVLGYSGNDYWIGRSFFGTAWGISGYFKMKMGSANLGIETKCLYAGATL